MEGLWGRVIGQDREGQSFDRLRKINSTVYNRTTSRRLEKLTYCRQGVRDKEKEGHIIVSSGAAVSSAPQLSQATTSLRNSGRTTLEVRQFVCALDYRRLTNNKHCIFFLQNQSLLKEDLKQLFNLHCLPIYIF